MIRWQLWGIVVQPVPVVQPFQRVRENVVSRKLTAPSTAVVSTDTDENKATNQCHPRYQSCLNRRRLTFLKCRLRLAGEEESPNNTPIPPKDAIWPIRLRDFTRFSSVCTSKC